MRKIEPLESGRFKVRFRLAGKQTSETFDRKQDAVTFAKTLDAIGPQGALDRLYESEQDRTVPTLNELAEAHIESLPNVTDGTRLNYRRLWERSWGPLIGSARVHNLDDDALSLAARRLGAKYSRKSLENQRGLLAGVMQRGVRKGYIADNLARGMKLPHGQPSRGKDEMRILTPDEFAEVEARMDPHYRLLIRFLWGTGCRWGEAVALPVAKVRLPNVSFHQALKWSPDNQREIGGTKTKKSRRTIVLPPDLIPEVGEAINGKAGDELVFTAHQGGPVAHRTFWYRYWLPATRHLTPRPRIHDLRHSHASWLLGRGVPIHVVQARLGHESIRTTVDTYSHLLPDAQQAAANAAALAFQSFPAQDPARAIESRV